MLSDQQVQKLIDGLDENDPSRKALIELLNTRSNNRFEINRLREARDFYKRQTELDAFKCV